MTRTIDFEYVPAGDVIAAFHDSDAFVRILEGPLGSAKTTACCVEIFARAEEQTPDDQGVRRSRWLVVRNTYPELDTTTIPSWRDLFDDRFGRFTRGTPPRHELRINLPDGTRIEADVTFMALDGPDAPDKIRGMELTGIWFNEIREIPKPVVDMGTGRVGRFPPKRATPDGRGPSWYGVLADSNMPDEDHWLYRYAEEEHPKGWAFFRQPGAVLRQAGDRGGSTGAPIKTRWRLNPTAENLANLPTGYYENQLAGKSEDWIKVYLSAEYGYVQDGRPVYPEYTDSLHCPAPAIDPVPGLSMGIGIDFGLTPAALFGQQLPNGCINWIDELATEDMGTVRFAELLKTKLARDYPGYEVDFWGDPAGEQRAQTDERTPFQILRAMGIPARRAPTNDFTIRREAVARPLSRLVDGRPGLLISKRCPVTRKGMMGGYSYRRVRVSAPSEDAVRFHDLPDKTRFSHPCEAGQYLNLGFGEGRAVIGKRRRTDIRPRRAGRADGGYDAHGF